MRGRPVLHRIELGAWEPSMLREVLLALFFLAGALAGHVYALCCDEGAQAELGRYLRDFCAVYDAGGTASSLWSCAVLYFGSGVLVFLLGHVLNLAINALGSYVHTSRLQYVEFFGKFFEGGGEAFRPLRPATKYVYVNNQEE